MQRAQGFGKDQDREIRPRKGGFNDRVHVFVRESVPDAHEAVDRAALCPMPRERWTTRRIGGFIVSAAFRRWGEP